MIGQVGRSFRRLYQSYWVINDVRNYNVGTGHSILPNLKCGDEKTDPWGSFIPVFSKSTRKIYNNSACAEADNVTDGVLWNFIINCKYLPNTIHINDIPQYISNLHQNSFPKICHLHFKYPGNIFDLKSERCYTNLISTCANEKFAIPGNINLTMSQIRQACTSGLVSPYRATDMYANVFCHICNGNRYSERDKCYIDADGTRRFSGFFMHFHVDGIFLSETFRRLKEMKTVPPPCPENYVFDRMNETCRHVYCPSGQLRDKNNKCVFWVKKIFMNKLDINIMLTADTVFDIRETFTSNNFSLSHEWPPRLWIIKSVSKRILNTHMHRNLYIKMINLFPKAYTWKLLKSIWKLLKLPWTLTLSNGTLISMSAELGFDTKLFSNDDSIQTLNKDEINRMTFDLPQFSDLHDEKFIRFFTSSFVVTKMYFCEQIELNPSEYELWDKRVLYNKITNQPLFNGEFAITTAPHFEGKMRARVCLEDSGLMESDVIKRVVKSGSARVAFFYSFSAVIWLSLVATCL
ncbi:uncharacterized protein LOC132748948 [Ruditapes philippinarum]|uniref:uncharacterized protein LOC132748948 n=1 Tax=Ruditapes philippinarum TaxID=129788 RepID=UPI00295BF8FB|nr:uncharacterized protein LOC132748948 [Ruditapes philippinarum]